MCRPPPPRCSQPGRALLGLVTRALKPLGWEQRASKGSLLKGIKAGWRVLNARPEEEMGPHTAQGPRVRSKEDKSIHRKSKAQLDPSVPRSHHQQVGFSPEAATGLWPPVPH